MSNSVKIIAILDAKPNQAEKLAAFLAAMAPDCRDEAGNLRWDIWRDQSDPNRFVLDELYVDVEAVRAHREAAHFKHYLANISDLAERTPYVRDTVDAA